jgi:hypothetical protein
MNVRRSIAICRAHIRELSRRKMAIFLLLALPMAFYFAAFDDEIAVSFATVGFGWSIAIVSLFATHSLRAATPRLALIGYRPADIVIGRILSIGCYASVLGTLLFLFLRTDDVVVSPSHLLASLGFAFLGSSTAGLAVAAVTDRELEGMLTLIGLMSLTLVTASESLVSKVLPMYATDQHAWAAVNGSLRSGTHPWRSTLAVAAALAVIAGIATLAKMPRLQRRTNNVPQS